MLREVIRKQQAVIEKLNKELAKSKEQNAKNHQEILNLKQILSMLEENGKRPFYRSIDSGLIPKKSVLDNLAALEQITFIGYPSGLYDDYNKTPLIRQGWTSTPAWNDYKGKREFLVDASVFEGSSGSPAFIFNQGSYPTTDGIAIGSRLLFMGVITQTITKEKSEHLDLGTVIRSDAMLDKLKPFVEGLL